MIKSTAILQFLCFCVFFAAGAGAIAVSILADEIQSFYHTRNFHQQTLEETKRIESLIASYEAQIEQIEKDPNVLQKLESITFGKKPDAPDTTYPAAEEKLLAEASKAVLGDRQKQNSGHNIPQWVQRCCRVNIRIGLFVAGAGLVLFSFIFFAASDEQTALPHTPGGTC